MCEVVPEEAAKPHDGTGNIAELEQKAARYAIRYRDVKRTRIRHVRTYVRRVTAMPL